MDDTVDYSDTELLNLGQQFDQQALAEIYDRYSDPLYRYAYRLTGSEQMAEDCVSETFSRYLNALEKKKGPRDLLRPYLYRIAHNWIMDQFRKNKSEISIEATTQPFVARDQHVDDAVSEKEQAELLRQHVERLSPDQRHVIVLKYLEQMDNAEIARIIGRNVGSVKALHSRALNNLRDWIG
jgi:RNA polymerase sigma-70 factor (ECF subfamily)